MCARYCHTASPWIRSPPRAGRLLENLLACATQHGAGCGVQFVKEREPGSLEQGAMEQHTLRTRSPLLRITDGQCAVGRDCVGRQSAPESDGIGVRGHGTSVWLATASSRHRLHAVGYCKVPTVRLGKKEKKALFDFSLLFTEIRQMTRTTHTQPNAAARLAPNRAMQGCLGRTRCVLSFAHPATMHSRAVWACRPGRCPTCCSKARCFALTGAAPITPTTTASSSSRSSPPRAASTGHRRPAAAAIIYLPPNHGSNSGEHGES